MEFAPFMPVDFMDKEKYLRAGSEFFQKLKLKNKDSLCLRHYAKNPLALDETSSR